MSDDEQDERHRRPEHRYSAEEGRLVRLELAGRLDDDTPARRQRGVRYIMEDQYFGDMLAGAQPTRDGDSVKVHGKNTVSILRDMVAGLQEGGGRLYPHTSRTGNAHDMVEMRHRAHVGHRASKHDPRLIGLHKASEVKAVGSMSDEQFAAYARRMARLDTGEGIDDTAELKSKLEAEALEAGGGPGQSDEEDSDEERAAERRLARRGKRRRTAVASTTDDKNVKRMRGFVSSLLAGQQRAVAEAKRRAAARRARQYREESP